jgi:predicted nucleotidyltransferase
MSLAGGPPDTAAIAQALRPCLRRQPLASAWLYGSVARGDARRSSDVDLGVLFAQHLGTDQRRVLQDVEREAGRALPGRALSVVDLEQAPLLLQHRVLRDGLVLVDCDPRVRSRFVAGVLERFCATRAVRSTFDGATRYRLAHAATLRGAG